MTRDEKIVKIKQDRIELLKIVNENLKQSKKMHSRINRRNN